MYGCFRVEGDVFADGAEDAFLLEEVAFAFAVLVPARVHFLCELLFEFVFVRFRDGGVLYGTLDF